MRKNDMKGKALVFVLGHRRPSVAPLDARYVRRLPDETPMLATGTRDTIEAAVARWEKAQAATKPETQKALRKKEVGQDG